MSLSLREKKLGKTYFLSSVAFNSTRVLSGGTRAANTGSVFRNDSLSKISLELVYGGGDASRKRWRACAMLRLNNCRFCVNNGRATMSMESEDADSATIYRLILVTGNLMSDLPDATILGHIVDVHCHPTDAPDGISSGSMQRLGITVCAMSTRQTDQVLVKELATAYPEKVVPCFG